MTAGYDSPHWLTFQQAKQLGGFVRKGEHGTGVVYISRFRKKETDGEEVEKEIPFLKEHQVLNADQCDGLLQQFSPHVKSPVRPLGRTAAVDQLVRNTQAVIIEGGIEASYSPRSDPGHPFRSFNSTGARCRELQTDLSSGRQFSTRASFL